MKSELPIDREALRGEIAREYGLEAGPLEFLPKGEVACAYLFEAGDRTRYLLKLFTGSRMARIRATEGCRAARGRVAGAHIGRREWESTHATRCS